MADIELVIKIPEEDYERCKKRFQMRIDIMGDAIAKGTPLPEHHGRLIDADAYRKKMLDSREFDFFKRLDMQLTVIPATKPPRWIERRLQMGVHDWMCSVCKCQSEDTVRICPNCGVDTEGRYEMEEDDGGYWFQQREEQTATKEGDGE